MQEQIRKRQNLTEEKIESEIEIETKNARRSLPMWCRGIMSGCVNCGGCV